MFCKKDYTQTLKMNLVVIYQAHKRIQSGSLYTTITGTIVALQGQHYYVVDKIKSCITGDIPSFCTWLHSI